VNYQIRAKLLFTKQDHEYVPVKRCFWHRTGNRHCPNERHLVQHVDKGSHVACYELQENHPSIVVKLGPAPTGGYELPVKLKFYFGCYTACDFTRFSPIKLVFTLEDEE
jgi:P53 DNA-binding domain